MNYIDGIICDVTFQNQAFVAEIRCKVRISIIMRKRVSLAFIWCIIYVFMPYKSKVIVIGISSSTRPNLCGAANPPVLAGRLPFLHYIESEFQNFFLSYSKGPIFLRKTCILSSCTVSQCDEHCGCIIVAACYRLSNYVRCYSSMYLATYARFQASTDRLLTWWSFQGSQRQQEFTCFVIYARLILALNPGGFYDIKIHMKTTRPSKNVSPARPKWQKNREICGVSRKKRLCKDYVVFYLFQCFTWNCCGILSFSLLETCPKMQETSCFSSHF